MPAPALVHSVGQQDKLETLCHFVKLGRQELPQIKVQELVTKSDRGCKRQNLWASGETEGEDVVVINSETDKAPHPA